MVYQGRRCRPVQPTTVASGLATRRKGRTGEFTPAVVVLAAEARLSHSPWPGSDCVFPPNLQRGSPCAEGRNPGEQPSPTLPRAFALLAHVCAHRHSLLFVFLFKIKLRSGD